MRRVRDVVGKLSFNFRWSGKPQWGGGDVCTDLQEGVAMGTSGSK